MKKSFIVHLQETYTLRVKRNPRYSLRSYARDLNTSHATLSSLLRGVRPLRKKTALKLAQALDLTESEFYEHFSIEESQGELFKQIDLEIIETMKNWYYDAILELSRLEDFEDSASWVALRLNISTEEAQKALDLLVRLELLVTGEDGKLVEAMGDTSLLVEDTTSALRALQIELLEKSLESLKRDSLKERDHSSLTLAINKKDLANAKGIIKEFRHKMCTFMQRKGNNPNEVYQLCVSFFPLSSKT